jgi:glutamate-1-semialdehyde 2,1-aminomutase
MAAGLATLRALSASVYEQLEDAGAALLNGLVEAAAAAGVPARVTRAGSLLTLFLADDAQFASFFHAMLEAGIMLPPSQQEAWFVSAAHGSAEIETTVAAARQALATIGAADA